jgi:hypothetical protein
VLFRYVTEKRPSPDLEEPVIAPKRIRLNRKGISSWRYVVTRLASFTVIKHSHFQDDVPAHSVLWWRVTSSAFTVLQNGVCGECLFSGWAINFLIMLHLYSQQQRQRHWMKYGSLCILNKFHLFAFSSQWSSLLDFFVAHCCMCSCFCLWWLFFSLFTGILHSFINNIFYFL